MRACPSCFAAGTWVSNPSPPEASPATCDFGHSYAPQTWPTTAWVDSFSRLFSIYEVAPGTQGEELAVRIQEDWSIFALSRAKVHEFLVSVFPDGHDLFASGVRVVLRSRSDGALADHIGSWAEFSDEIRTANRYFPKSAPDRDLLSRVLLATVVQMSPDIDLFRARVVDGAVPAAGEMGAPPPGRAGSGRANPVGISYLYLAFSRDTCVYESRAGNHSTIAVGRFRPRRLLTVLDLADIAPPDLFSVVEIESVDDQISQVAIHRYLKALSAELSKPVRISDQPTDYIPTQYLCELVKSLGIDGVLYSSSLDKDGRNVVLFDVESAVCVEAPQLVQVTSLKAEWKLLDGAS